MSKLYNLLAFLFFCGLGLFSVLFGVYLLHEKVGLSLHTGETLERIGLITRLIDPFWFWLAVFIYTMAGTVITIGGLCLLIWLLRAAFNGRLSDDG